MSAPHFLARWAVLGVVAFLCAPWLLPSNKLYHQILIFLLWLPALISLVYGQLRPRLPRLDLLLYGGLAGWTLVVLVMVGGNDPVSEAKVILYVSLTLIGILLVDRVLPQVLERVLVLAVLVAGVGALSSWIEFYALADHSYGRRLIALGLWDTIIMAAHAVGALGVIGAGLSISPLQNRQSLLFIGIATAACLLFLLFSQTRGVWLGLLGVLALVLIGVPWRIRIVAILAFVAAIAAVIWYDAYLLLQRGLSYRPELWRAGANLVMGNPLLGLGFHDFHLAVPGLKRLFKHPHNLFLDTSIRLGLIGLLSFSALWVRCAFLAWQARGEALGRSVLMLWTFSTLSLMTDGIGLWLKPNADWMVTWLPISLGLVLAQRARASITSKQPIPGG